MAVFIAAKQRFVVHPAARVAICALTPDTGRVTTVEDFYRARYLYQLSREGEAAERALALYETELGRRGPVV